MYIYYTSKDTYTFYTLNFRLDNVKNTIQKYNILKRKNLHQNFQK